MKLAKATATIILACLAVSAWAEEQLLPENAFTGKSVRYHENGSLKKCKLRIPTVVQGYPCQCWLRFYPSGRLKELRLSESKRIQGIEIPRKSVVFFRSDGLLDHCWLRKDLTIQGIPCNGGFMKADTGFHRNGKLAYCGLSKSTDIQGIPCKASPFTNVVFHPSGKLKKCTLSKDHTINGTEYGKGTALRFDSAGNVQSSE